MTLSRADMILASMPGFVNSVNPSMKVTKEASHVFSLSFVLGFCLCKLSLTSEPLLRQWLILDLNLACVFSYTLHLLFPVKYPEETVLDGEDGSQYGVSYEEAVEVPENSKSPVVKEY